MTHAIRVGCAGRSAPEQQQRNQAGQPARAGDVRAAIEAANGAAGLKVLRSEMRLDPGMHVLTKRFAMEALASRIKGLISNRETSRTRRLVGGG